MTGYPPRFKDGPLGQQPSVPWPLNIDGTVNVDALRCEMTGSSCWGEATIVRCPCTTCVKYRELTGDGDANSK